MPPGLGPRESLALVLLYQAGAHLEALTQALGRDVRTVRKVLRQAGRAAAHGPAAPRRLARRPRPGDHRRARRLPHARWRSGTARPGSRFTSRPRSPRRASLALPARAPIPRSSILPRSWNCPKTWARGSGWHSPACCWSMPKVWPRPRLSTPKARPRHTCAPALPVPRRHTSSWTSDHGGAPMRWLTRWHRTPTPPLTTEALVITGPGPPGAAARRAHRPAPPGRCRPDAPADPAPPGGLLLGSARLCGASPQSALWPAHA